MKKKALLLGFFLVGLLSITFAVPAAAQCGTKPGFLLDNDDVPGWELYNESCFGYSYSGYSFDFWWQIWIYPNNTVSWGEVQKAVCIIIMDFGVDLNKDIVPGYSLWDAIEEAFGSMGATVVTGTGLDHCIMWEDTSVWFALGNKGSILVMAAGWASDIGPSGFLSKTPVKVAASAATEEDIEALMTAQGSEIPGGIPGFTLIPIFLSIAIVLGIIFILRKDQLKYVKTF